VPISRDSQILRVIRGGLLALVAFGTVGMTIELLLIGHTEDANQLIPLVLAAAGLVVSAIVAVRPRMFALRALQFVMLLYIGAGIVGIVLHVQANAEFQHDIDPTIAGMALYRKVLTATAPPALAPGMLMQLGLLGLLYTYRHPVLGEGQTGFDQGV
jgi:hypothetical protein